MTNPPRLAPGQLGGLRRPAGWSLRYTRWRSMRERRPVVLLMDDVVSQSSRIRSSAWSPRKWPKALELSSHMTDISSRRITRGQTATGPLASGHPRTTRTSPPPTSAKDGAPGIGQGRADGVPGSSRWATPRAGRRRQTKAGISACPARPGRAGNQRLTRRWRRRGRRRRSARATAGQKTITAIDPTPADQRGSAPHGGEAASRMARANRIAPKMRAIAMKTTISWRARRGTTGRRPRELAVAVAGGGSNRRRRARRAPPTSQKHAASSADARLGDACHAAAVYLMGTAAPRHQPPKRRSHGYRPSMPIQTQSKPVGAVRWSR